MARLVREHGDRPTAATAAVGEEGEEEAWAAGGEVTAEKGWETVVAETVWVAEAAMAEVEAEAGRAAAAAAMATVGRATVGPCRAERAAGRAGRERRRHRCAGSSACCTPCGTCCGRA